MFGLVSVHLVLWEHHSLAEEEQDEQGLEDWLCRHYCCMVMVLVALAATVRDLGTDHNLLVAWVAEYMGQVQQVEAHKDQGKQVNTPDGSLGPGHLSKVEEETGIHTKKFLQYHMKEVLVVVEGQDMMAEGGSGVQGELLGNHTGQNLCP